jgi:non-heme chloroperoxidase
MNIYKLFTPVIILILTWSCSSPESRIAATHQIKFVNGSSNNKLEVLDWGGKGRSLILLTGLGNSAHIFDDFAPRFTDSFHVFAITRRGFGASQQSTSYDMKALTDDILAIMDSLHIDKAILAGHSIAGDELTRFAVMHPSRVDKIIYLDAAYDRTLIGPMMQYMPEFPTPTTKDSSSFINYKNFLVKLTGINIPDDDLRQVAVFSKDGKYMRDSTPGSVLGAIISSVEIPDYAHITSPALAIYASNDSITSSLPFYPWLDSINKQKADTAFMLAEKFRAKEITRFSRETPGGRVETIKGANHYIFLTHPDETERLMREFLRD